jgi:hypothetical protein
MSLPAFSTKGTEDADNEGVATFHKTGASGASGAGRVGIRKLMNQSHQSQQSQRLARAATTQLHKKKRRG